jgi:hypothetical protein
MSCLDLRHRLSLAAGFILLVGNAGAAQASVVTFDITGAVTGASAGGFLGGSAQLPAGAVVGAPVFATLSYDTASPGSVGSAGSIDFSLMSFDFAVSIAGNLWDAHSGGMSLALSPATQLSAVQLVAQNFSAFPNPPNVSLAHQISQFIELEIGASTPGFLPGLTLPTAPLDLALADTAFGFIEGYACFCFGPGPFPFAEYQISFSLVHMTDEVAAVIEPPSAAVFGTTLLGFGWLRRRAARLPRRRS